jgi:hypothetical protein
MFPRAGQHASIRWWHCATSEVPGPNTPHYAAFCFSGLKLRRLLTGLVVIERGQTVKRDIASPFTRQVRQFADQLKPHFFMALAARRKDLAGNQSDFMGQPVLGVNDAVDPADRNSLRALVE